MCCIGIAIHTLYIGILVMKNIVNKYHNLISSLHFLCFFFFLLGQTIIVGSEILQIIANNKVT